MQGVVTWVQVPETLQVPTAVTEVGPEQVAVPQVSPRWVWHPVPFVLHKSVLPQGVSVHSVEQQILVEPDPLPIQWAFAHSVSAVHTCPSVFLQAPPEQT